MAVQATFRRIGILHQRHDCSWRVSSNLVHYRAFSDRPSSDIVRISDQEVTRKALEAAAREDRLDLHTAARLLMSSPQDERKFGWDFHLVQFFFACLPPLAVYAVAQYSRYDQRQMQKDRDAKIEKLVKAELEIEVDVELEEVSAMLKSRNPDLEALRMRLEAMEEKLMRLEPVVQQTGKPPQKTIEAAAIVLPQGIKSPVPPLEVEGQKPSVPESDIGGITNIEKKGEGTSEGYWTWLTGKRRAVSNDVSAKTQ